MPAINDRERLSAALAELALGGYDTAGGEYCYDTRTRATMGGKLVNIV